MTITKYRSVEHLYQGSAGYPTCTHDVENIAPKSKEEKTFLKYIQEKFLHFGTYLAKPKLEIVAFLFAFSHMMTKITSTTLIIDKVCSVHMKFPPSICGDLENHTDIKSAVEKLASNYQLGRSLIQLTPAAVLVCFIGPWSDHYGRKFPIILALLGMIIDALGSTVCAYFLESRVEYYFIPAIFSGIFGGPVSIMAVIYSYASDSTPYSGRTMKYAFLEMAVGFAFPFGSTTGGWVYELIGYPPVFFFSAGGFCLSLIYVMFLLKETRGLDNDDPWSIKIRKLFSCKSFKETFIATIRKRPHQGRKQVLLLITSMCFLILTLHSTGDINYLYVHHQFGWGNAKYSTIMAIYSVFAIVLLLIVIPLLRYFKVGDPVLGLIGTTSLLGKNIGIGLAWKEGVFHLGNLFGLLGGCSSLAARSRISKVVSNEDLGKVFSFVVTAESLLPIVASILMTQTFNAFLDTFPGMPYMILAIFILIPVGVFSWMCSLPKMSYEDISQISSNREDLYTSI